MYGYPVRLQPVSNREDLNIPVSIFDDDTGDAVNLSGIAGTGTFSNWNVSAGAVLTTSLTPMTIPVFPYGNNLAALSFVVPIGLAITAGNPITISDVSGANTMQGYVISYNTLTGALVAQIGVTFQFEIRAKGPYQIGWGDGYAPWPSIGTIDRAALITASLGNGILFVEPSVALVTIPESTFRRLHLGTYVSGMTMSDSQNVRQVFVAETPVIYGNVTG